MAAFVSGSLVSSTLFLRVIAASPKLSPGEAEDMRNVVVPTFGAAAGVVAGCSVVSVIEEVESSYRHSFGLVRQTLARAVTLRARHFGAGVAGMGAVVLLGSAGAHLAQSET